MQKQSVFNEKKEIRRLKVQNRLLSAYEKPVLERVFAQREHIRVLDIGCNNGEKTVQRFADPCVEKVVGLEYNPELALEAQDRFGNDKFSFFSADVENPTFQILLTKQMQEMEAFDVIYLSFVLMHLQEPERVLKALRPFLAPDGVLMIVEADDENAALIPDEGNLLHSFLHLLAQDPLAGNRQLGALLEEKLSNCGYENIASWCKGIEAWGDDKYVKADIFETFFSYLPEDVAQLLKEEPDNEVYRGCSSWLNAHYQELWRLIMSEHSQITMGMKILSCVRGTL